MTNPIKTRLRTASVVFCLGVCFVDWYSTHAQNRRPASNLLSKWRPTRELQGVSYVGSKVCMQCHTDQAATQSKNSMFTAAASSPDCEVLKEYPRLTFNNGPYSYNIERQKGRSIYTVTNGTRRISEPILYCFGRGRVGQTYILEHDGTLYESRVSYFPRIQSLDFTILHPHSVPASLEDALGRALTPEAAQGCFACHSIDAVRNGQLQPDHLIPGVGCEGCHGPGEKHLAAVRARDFKNLQIFNPASMDSDDLTQEFCGACHRGFEQVLHLPGQDGINNVRYQPYRIFNSRGHKGDERISCVSCHNPHDRLESDVAFYDAKCLACHLTSRDDLKTARRSAPACPVSKTQCATCHMQKIEIPGAHARFTDHWIRVIKANEPIPRD
jgi:Cytochrome c554 and c-prime